MGKAGVYMLRNDYSFADLTEVWRVRDRRFAIGVMCSGVVDECAADVMMIIAAHVGKVCS